MGADDAFPGLPTDQELGEDLATLRELVDEADMANRRLTDRIAALEQRMTDISKLYAASCRLHVPLQQEAVLDAIREIVVNFVGCEQLAVLLHEEPTRELKVAISMGLSVDQLRQLEKDPAPLAGAAREGRLWAAGSADRATVAGLPLSACIPLVFEGRTLGIAAIFRLLPQKPALDRLDGMILELLSQQGARALHCAELQERLQALSPPPV